RVSIPLVRAGVPRLPAPAAARGTEPRRLRTMVSVRTELMRRLRSATDSELADLVRDRPDLGTPLPSSTAALAARAVTPASVRRALANLRAPELRAAETLAVGRVAARPEELAA